MKKAILILNLLLLTISISAHPWKPRHYVIVDTDGGVDDLKALCMLASSPDVRLLAVTVSAGYNNENVAYEKVRSLFDGLWHEGLPVVSGENSVRLIEKILSEESTPVTFIALGTLNTVSDAMDQVPDFTKKIKRIIWSNNSLTDKTGFNYRSAPGAADKVLASGFPIEAAGSGGEGFYDEALLSQLSESSSPGASMVMQIIESKKSHSFAYDAFDEMVPLLLHYPSLFTMDGEAIGNRFYTPGNTGLLRQAAIKILIGETVAQMQTIKAFPADTAFYMKDVQPFVTDIRSKYGEDEWTSGVIANELHRHLGVFAIIGVKMGIRAREYFCTGVDEMRVTSMAGNTPPLSCMNDGIQVSTGATPGHGLLTVRAEGPFTPTADFTYKNTVIRISLKKDLAEKVSGELKEINFIYGLDSDIYWELVRQNSIKYWKQLDRHEIFDIEIIKQ